MTKKVSGASKPHTGNDRTTATRVSCPLCNQADALDRLAQMDEARGEFFFACSKCGVYLVWVLRVGNWLVVGMAPQQLELGLS